MKLKLVRSFFKDSKNLIQSSFRFLFFFFKLIFSILFTNLTEAYIGRKGILSPEHLRLHPLVAEKEIADEFLVITKPLVVELHDRQEHWIRLLYHFLEGVVLPQTYILLDLVEVPKDSPEFRVDQFSRLAQRKRLELEPVEGGVANG